MNAKFCGHHCMFVCSPNLCTRVPLRGKNLYGGRELVDVRLPLGFRRMSRIRPLKTNDQYTETRGDLSVTTVAWTLGCLKPRTHWRYGIYTDFRSALSIPIFRWSMGNPGLFWSCFRAQLQYYAGSNSTELPDHKVRCLLPMRYPANPFSSSERFATIFTQSSNFSFVPPK